MTEHADHLVELRGQRLYCITCGLVALDDDPPPAPEIDPLDNAARPGLTTQIDLETDGHGVSADAAIQIRW